MQILSACCLMKNLSVSVLLSFLMIAANHEGSALMLNMTVKGGTSQACASCKYQRRRCQEDCAMAPYFPADQLKQFLNVHRLFGVSNVQKHLGRLHESQKGEAMKAIIYQANARARDPVYGCLGVIVRLQREIEYIQGELHLVRCQILFYQQQLQQQALTEQIQRQQIAAASLDGPEGLIRLEEEEEEGVLELNGEDPLMTQEYLNCPSFQQSATAKALGASCEIELKDFHVDDGIVYPETAAEQDYDDIKPLDPLLFDPCKQDDMVDYTEAYESSAESSLKEIQAIEHDVPKDHLKIMHQTILAK